MRKIMLILVILAIILTACNAAKQNTATKNVPTGAVVVQEEIIEEENEGIPLASIEKAEETAPVELTPLPVENKIVVEKSRRFSPELRDLLQKADTEVKSLNYMYAESPGNIGFDTYLVKGTKIKILLFEKNDYVIDDYFNVVYVDTAVKTVKGRCENRKRCLSKSVDNTKRTYELKYEDYRTKTPYEWLKGIEFAEIIGLETLNNHAVTKIRTEKDGAVIEMWVDNRYGVPHRIKVAKDGEERTYYFKNMMFNNVKDSDVVLKN